MTTPIAAVEAIYHVCSALQLSTKKKGSNDSRERERERERGRESGEISKQGDQVWNGIRGRRFRCVSHGLNDCGEKKCHAKAWHGMTEILMKAPHTRGASTSLAPLFLFLSSKVTVTNAEVGRTYGSWPCARVRARGYPLDGPRAAYARPPIGRILFRSIYKEKKDAIWKPLGSQVFRDIDPKSSQGGRPWSNSRTERLDF